jgi:putative ABC transport system permease protein
VERRRELGIRIAIGASAGSIVRSVAGGLMAAILAGAIAGLTVGLAVVRFIALLLYQVKPTDASALAIPALALFGTASLAALPALLRAIRIEPSAILRDQ